MVWQKGTHSLIFLVVGRRTYYFRTSFIKKSEKACLKGYFYRKKVESGLKPSLDYNRLRV